MSPPGAAIWSTIETSAVPAMLTVGIRGLALGKFQTGRRVARYVG